MIEKIPGTDAIVFKDGFIKRYQQLTDFTTFKKYSLSFLRRSIRVNTLKISVNDLKKRLQNTWELEPIPWCKEGFWIDHKGEDEAYRRDVGNLLEHQFGMVYIQEAASMIPPLVLDPQPGELVLDMCAAPGSKATQIAQYMRNQGVLIANDFKGDRLRPLGLNMQRCGISNAVVTMMRGHFFKDFQFDKILVDAPCSGTGTIRKSLKTLLMWNPHMVKRLASQQKQLLETAFQNLKVGGTLVYSTCTLEPEEDEGVVSYLLEKYPSAHLEEIKLPLQRSKPIIEFEGKKFHPPVEHCLRLWPQDNDTEGFFVAKIRKEK